MEERLVASLEQTLGLAPHDGAELMLGRPAPHEKAEQCAGLLDPLLRVLEPGGVEHEHVPQRAGQPATRQHVVADVRNPALRQRRAALLKQAIAHPRPDPRVDAVRYHVVEGLRRQLELLDRADLERHVRDTDRRHERAAALDRSLRRVDAVKARAGRGASGRTGAPGRARRRTRTAQNFLFCLTSQPALIDAPSEPSGFCCLYSTWIFEKLSDTESAGTTSPSAPPVW